VGPPRAGRRRRTARDHTEESEKIRALKKENAELRRANEILKAASSFFAAELDRPHR
jgi:transposase-like protein